MLNVTPALKAYMVKHFGVSADADDVTVRKAVGTAVIEKKLGAKRIAELTGGKAVTPPPKPQPKPQPRKDTQPVTRPQPKPVARKATTPPPRVVLPANLDEMINKKVQETLKKSGLHSRPRTASEDEYERRRMPSPAKLFSQAGLVRVKSAAEQYSHNTKGADYPMYTRKGNQVHPRAGQPAIFQGKQLEHPSELAKAVSASWLKWCIHHSPGGVEGLPQNLRLTDHDRDLVGYAMRSLPWNGYVKGTMGEEQRVHRKKLTEFQVKALLDDTVSGGIEATPVVFDEAIVLIPVLHGELFPFVNVQNIARGRRVKGAQMTNPTFTSGVAEGTSITPFNTASFVTAFDTAIFAATGAMELGLDFEEDSPVDLGSTIIDKYGEKALEYLDRVIATGNGYNEPLGILNTTGLITISSDSGVGGPPTVSDYEGMYFGVAKQWRNEPGALCAYVANDTTYRRSRGIPVGPADERRVFGMTHADYELLGRPYKVQNDISNTKACFVNLKRYRMYRRLGLTVRVETQGRTLALNNTRLIVVRMRYGGQLENANAASAIVDFQS